MSPCKEDSRAACPAQFDTRSAPGLDGGSAAGAAGTQVEQLPADAVTTAITLLANVIAKAAAPSGSEVAGDE